MKRRRGLRVLLWLVMVTGYFNALLRTSAESQLTLFRIVFPVAAVLVPVKFIRWPVTQRALAYAAIVFAYSVAQIIVFGFLEDPLIWSYLINMVALVMYLYLVLMFQTLFGPARLQRHLYTFYKVLIIASAHQLLTGWVYPYTMIPGAGRYALIWYGQQNDASLALAAFIPTLLPNCRRGLSTKLWLVAGLVVLYINNTRGVVVAVATYLALVWLAPGIRVLRRDFRAPRSLTPFLLVGTIVGAIAMFGDREITLSEGVTSINALLVRPLSQIVTGEKMTQQITSINLRVTLAITGIERLVGTYGFGVGPGASTHFVEEYYAGIARSMHVFPLQLLVESGWLFVFLFWWVVRTCRRRVGWPQASRGLLFCLMVTSSITSGAITNYYFFACAVTLLSTPERPRLLRNRHLKAAVRQPLLADGHLTTSGRPAYGTGSAPA